MPHQPNTSHTSDSFRNLALPIAYLFALGDGKASVIHPSIPWPPEGGGRVNFCHKKLLHTSILLLSALFQLYGIKVQSSAKEQMKNLAKKPFFLFSFPGYGLIESRLLHDVFTTWSCWTLKLLTAYYTYRKWHVIYCVTSSTSAFCSYMNMFEKELSKQKTNKGYSSSAPP